MRWRYRDTVLALCTYAFLVTMFGRLALSPVVPEITAEFAVSNSVIGIGLGGMWLAYGLAQYPSGVFADRYGDRAIILLAVAGTTVAALLVAITPFFIAFVVATVILGAFAGLHFSVATTLLARIHDNVGTAIGIHNAGATVAGLAAPIVVAWVAVRYGWRLAVGTVVLVGVPAVLLLLYYMEPTEPRRPDAAIGAGFELGLIADLLSRPSVLFTLFVATAGEFVWQGTASFLPTFLIEHRNQSTTLAGAVFSACFAAQGIAQIGVGAAADRFGRDRVTVSCMALGAVGFWLLIAVPGLEAALVGVTLLGVGMSFSPAVLPRFFAAFTDEERSEGFGLVRTVYMILASPGSVVVGLFADRFGWTVAFGSLLGLFVLVVCAFAINRALGFEL